MFSWICEAKPAASKIVDYWKSPVGIQRRIDAIGGDFTFRVYNGAMAFYGNEFKSDLKWVGYQDMRTCDYCSPKIGVVYPNGVYIPVLPFHSHCRCSWIIIPKSEV